MGLQWDKMIVTTDVKTGVIAKDSDSYNHVRRLWWGALNREHYYMRSIVCFDAALHYGLVQHGTGERGRSEYMVMVTNRIPNTYSRPRM